LSQDEIHYLIHVFEQIDRDNDGYIVLEEFVSLQSNKSISDRFLQYNSDSARKLFSLIDSTQKGAIAWSDFIWYYSCKLSALKDKVKQRLFRFSIEIFFIIS
jgi:Ca2+-binding EF-hand superfamily protein